MLVDLDNRMGYPIPISYFTVPLLFRPTPVIRVFATDIDSNTERVSAELISSGNRSPIVGTGGCTDVLFLFFRELIQLGGNCR